MVPVGTTAHPMSLAMPLSHVTLHGFILAKPSPRSISSLWLDIHSLALVLTPQG